MLLVCLCAGVCPSMDALGDEGQARQTADAPVSGGDSRDGDWLVVRLGAEPSTLNPVLSTDAYAAEIYSYIGESLLRRNFRTLELEPELAGSWSVSLDHLVYTFTLKQGIRWHDGEPFTAHDVLFSYQKIMDPAVDAAHLRNYYQDIARVDVLDPYRIQFTYRRPYFRGLEICGSIPLVPEHVYREGDFNNHPANRRPLGTGPYRFGHWKTGKEIVLDRNKDYWGSRVHLERMYFRIITDSTVALQVLKKQQLDMVGLTALQWVKQTESKKFQNNFDKIKFYEPYYSYIGWNARKPYFADYRVRRALTYMVNREKILDTLLFGMGMIVTGPFYVNAPESNPLIKAFPYDPEQAKRLLTQAGWIDRDGDGIREKNGIPFRFEFLISSGSTFAEQLSTILKEDLGQIGISMEIRKLEWAVFIQQIQDRKFDAVTLGWSLSVEADPYQVWHSSQSDRGSNFVGFVNDEADWIIEEARVTFDRARRIELYHRFHEILHEEQPYTFLFCTESLAAVHRRFRNVVVYPLGLRPVEWWVPAELWRYPG